MTAIDRLLVDGYEIDADIRDRLTSARHVRTMDGAASLELTIDDHDYRVLRSGLVAKTGRPTKRQRRIENFDQAAWARFGDVRLTLDGWFTRLAGASGSYGTTRSLTLTFEDELATLMRRQKKAIKSSRNTQTRAQFIGMLLGIARKEVGYALFFSPEESVKQTIKKADDPARQKGFAKNARLTIKGRQIDSEQRKHLTTSLKVADELGAGDKATLAMLVAGIGESGFRAIMNLGGSDYGGVFQGNVANGTWQIGDTDGMARSFLKGGKGFQAGGAMHLAASDQDLTPGDIATKVEASGQPGSFYQTYIEEAEAILDAWGGTEKVLSTRQQYGFRAGGKRDGVQHNYWDDAGDLAREVRWRLFADSNQLWFVTDEWLFTRQPVFTLDDGALTGGVLDVSFEADVGMPIAQVTVQARSEQWAGHPGSTVQLDDLGPLDGRWLIWTSEFDLLTDEVTLTLQRPAPKLKEPAPTIRTKSVSAVSDNVLDNGLVYPLAVHGTDLGGVAAHHARAFGNWQSDDAVDIGCPLGTPVYAVDNGTIIRLGGSYDGTGLSNPNGFNVTLKTKNNEWFYTHLRKRDASLKVGDKVTAGQLLGETGAANGVKHLHIASLKGDPEKLLGVKDTQ